MKHVAVPRRRFRTARTVSTRLARWLDPVPERERASRSRAPVSERDPGRRATRSAPSERNVSAIAALERKERRRRTRGERLSAAINRITGSTPFAIAHIVWFALWIGINTGRVRGAPIFDPYPFSLLTLIVSLEAIFLSVFLLMAQNRMTQEADKREHLDLQIDLLAEQELTALLHMLHALCKKLDVHVDLPHERIRQLLEDTDVGKLAHTIDDQLPER
jgi:uncharacterized membrane protein